MAEADGEAQVQVQATVQFPTFTTNVPLPGQLDLEGNLAEKWKKWKKVWDAYEIVTKLNEKDSRYFYHLHRTKCIRNTQWFAISVRR